MKEETIKYTGLDFEVGYTHQPEEKASLEYGGCHEEYKIESIKLGDNDMFEFFLDNELIEMMEEFLVDQIKG